MSANLSWFSPTWSNIIIEFLSSLKLDCLDSLTFSMDFSCAKCDVHWTKGLAAPHSPSTKFLKAISRSRHLSRTSEVRGQRFGGGVATIPLPRPFLYMADMGGALKQFSPLHLPGDKAKKLLLLNSHGDSGFWAGQENHERIQTVSLGPDLEMCVAVKLPFLILKKLDEPQRRRIRQSSLAKQQWLVSPYQREFLL